METKSLDQPVYFLTWTTYGTWLPGDARGWIDAANSGPREPIREGNVPLEDSVRPRLSTEPVLFDRRQRESVETRVDEVCQYRGWTLYARNCRTNHVHVVLLATERSPEEVLNSLKSWCSRSLNELAGEKRSRPWWTKHGSTRWLNTVDVFDAAVEYVLNRQ